MNIKYKKVTVHQCVNGIEEDTEVLIPDIEEETAEPVGVWGRRHQAYLAEHRQATLNELAASGKLNEYLAGVDRDAKALLDHVIEDMKKWNGVDEELKERDQMAWG